MSAISRLLKKARLVKLKHLTGGLLIATSIVMTGCKSAPSASMGPNGELMTDGILRTDLWNEPVSPSQQMKNLGGEYGDIASEIENFLGSDKQVNVPEVTRNSPELWTHLWQNLKTVKQDSYGSSYHQPRHKRGSGEKGELSDIYRLMGISAILGRESVAGQSVGVFSAEMGRFNESMALCRATQLPGDPLDPVDNAAFARSMEAYGYFSEGVVIDGMSGGKGVIGMQPEQLVDIYNPANEYLMKTTVMMLQTAQLADATAKAKQISISPERIAYLDKILTDPKFANIPKKSHNVYFLSLMQSERLQVMAPADRAKSPLMAELTATSQKAAATLVPLYHQIKLNRLDESQAQPYWVLTNAVKAYMSQNPAGPLVRPTSRILGDKTSVPVVPAPLPDGPDTDTP